MQNVSINQTVKTPLGEGVAMKTTYAQGEDEKSIKCLVRLPVNDITTAHLRDANCLTPRPHNEALFCFALSELQ